MAAIPVAILIDLCLVNKVEGVQAVTVIEPAKEVELIVVVDWTPARIKQEVQDVFPDAPIMLKVMKCEGGYKTDAYNPTNGSGDKGLFQISTKYHGHRTKQLGLDMNDPIDNLKYARTLYDESGLQPWQASKHCWSK